MVFPRNTFFLQGTGELAPAGPYPPKNKGHALVRVKGIEPSPQAWEARILPLNYTRSELWGTFIAKILPLKAEKVGVGAIFQVPPASSES